MYIYKFTLIVLNTLTNNVTELINTGAKWIFCDMPVSRGYRSCNFCVLNIWSQPSKIHHFLGKSSQSCHLFLDVFMVVCRCVDYFRDVA